MRTWNSVIENLKLKLRESRKFYRKMNKSKCKKSKSGKKILAKIINPSSLETFHKIIPIYWKKNSKMSTNKSKIIKGKSKRYKLTEWAAKTLLIKLPNCKPSNIKNFNTFRNLTLNFPLCQIYKQSILKNSKITVF